MGVVYRAHPGAPAEDGEVVRVGERYVFVLYRGDLHPKATNPEQLEPLTPVYADPDLEAAARNVAQMWGTAKALRLQLINIQWHRDRGNPNPQAEAMFTRAIQIKEAEEDAASPAPPVRRELPEHRCLLERPHDEHDWWYTPEGGGHMLSGEPDERDRRRAIKQWHCRGLRNCPAWPECDLAAVDSGEGRFCGTCQDYEGTCANDHCLTCGSRT